MGRHASHDPESGLEAETVQLRSSAAERAGSDDGPPTSGESGPAPLLPPWFLAGLLGVAGLLVVVGAVALVVALRPSGISSSSAAPTLVSREQQNQWADQYATPGWNNPENQTAFGTAMNRYLADLGRPALPSTLYASAITDCIDLRASRPDQIHGGSADPGRTMGDPASDWAALNAAIDVYCPDQDTYRDVLPRPATTPPAPPTTYAPNPGDPACADRAQSVFVQLARGRITLAQASAQLPSKVPASALETELEGVKRLEAQGASSDAAIGQASGTIAQACDY